MKVIVRCYLHDLNGVSPVESSYTSLMLVNFINAVPYPPVPLLNRNALMNMLYLKQRLYPLQWGICCHLKRFGQHVHC